MMDTEHGTTHDTGAPLAEEQGTTQPQPQQKEPQQEQGRMIPYSRFQEANNQRKQAEAALADVVVSVVDTVPEQMRALIPDLPPAQKILWINKAKAAGIFDTQSVPTQSPDSHRPQPKAQFDMNNASPFAMMTNGYK